MIHVTNWGNASWNWWAGWAGNVAHPTEWFDDSGVCNNIIYFMHTHVQACTSFTLLVTYLYIMTVLNHNTQIATDLSVTYSSYPSCSSHPAIFLHSRWTIWFLRYQPSTKGHYWVLWISTWWFYYSPSVDMQKCIKLAMSQWYPTECKLNCSMWKTTIGRSFFIPKKNIEFLSHAFDSFCMFTLRSLVHSTTHQSLPHSPTSRWWAPAGHGASRHRSCGRPRSPPSHPPEALQMHELRPGWGRRGWDVLGDWLIRYLSWFVMFWMDR